jgi:hypothetical protein
MNLRRTLITILLVLAAAGLTWAADNDNHQVTVTVNAINELAVTGGDVTLTITSATPGSDPDPETDNVSGLDWTTNEAGKKITVATDLAAPNFTLKILAQAVTGGTAEAEITLTVAAQDYVSSVGTTTGTCTSRYTGSATAAQGTGSDVHTITFTIIDS